MSDTRVRRRCGKCRKTLNAQEERWCARCTAIRHRTESPWAQTEDGCLTLDPVLERYGLHEVARTLRIATRSVQRIQQRTLDIDQARELADRFGVRVKDLWPQLAHVDQQLHGVDWSQDAACKGADLNIFFPSQDGPYSNEAAYTLAKTYCDRCPVQQTCLEEALFIEERGGQEPHGFVGGKRPMERRALLRFRRDAATHQIKKAV